jgi:hypothetical protein
VNAEIAAALFATQKTATDAPLRLESTRDTVLKAITTTVGASEDKGWIGVKNKDTTRALSAALRA